MKNAALIAAAPDMLEALEFAYTELQALKAHSSSINKILSAIVKAKGES